MRNLVLTLALLSIVLSPAYAAERITNGSFESWTDGNPDWWVAWQVVPNATWVEETSDLPPDDHGDSGLSCLSITFTVADTDNRSQFRTPTFVVADELVSMASFTVSAYIKGTYARIYAAHSDDDVTWTRDGANVVNLRDAGDVWTWKTSGTVDITTAAEGSPYFALSTHNYDGTALFDMISLKDDTSPVDDWYLY